MGSASLRTRNIFGWYLSQIESGKRTGTAEVLAAIAGALYVTLDDIV